MESKLIWKNGSPFYLINGKEQIPVSYRSFWPEGEKVKEFAEKGFHLFHASPTGVLNSIKVPYSNCGEVWVGEDRYDWDKLRAHMDMFIQADPEAKVALLVQLDTRDWYLEQNPDSSDSFHQLSIMCQDEKWRQSASNFLKAVLDFMEKEYPERVYAIHIMAGHTTEWYTNYPLPDMYTSPIYKKSFDEWFGDGRSIPTDEELMRAEQGVFRHPVKNKQAIEFWEFHSEAIEETICYFAAQAKAFTDRKLPVGVFYGYTMCFFHAHLRGHGALATVLRCKDVDLVFSPSAYRPFRSMDSSSALNMTVDSMRLHGKMYIHEIDNTTYMTTGNKFADSQQSLHQRPGSVADTIHYLRRDMARGLEHGGGYWWFDMWGCWYDNDEVMEQMALNRIATERILQAGTASVSQIAVFVDAYSSRYLADPAAYDMIYAPPGDGKGGIAVQYDTVYQQQEGFNSIGAPVGYFDSGDLLYEKFPHDRTKLYVFVNLFAPTEELKTKIQNLRAAGKSCLFLYAPGYITREGYSLSAMQALTGFDFSVAEEHKGRVVACEDKSLAWGGDRGVSPLFTVDGKDCEVLAVYEESGLPAGAVKMRDKGLDAWFACGTVPAKLLRDIAKRAGVFLYHEDDDPVYVNGGMFGMYSAQGGERTVHFPKDCTLIDLYDNDRQYITKNGTIKIPFSQKECKLFLIKK